MYKCEELFNLNHTLLGEALRGLYPWEVLGELGELICAVGETLSHEEYERRGEDIWVSRTARIEEGTSIAGPCIIGDGADIRHGAYIRGSVLIGKGCVVGNSTEVKNAIMMDEAKAPHFTYIGDSIVGYRAHLGAGTVLSNVRCDGGRVVVRTAPPITTSRRKMGAVIGDGCEVGCHCVLNPGTILGRGCLVYPLSSVRGVWGDGSRIDGRR